VKKIQLKRKSRKSPRAERKFTWEKGLVRDFARGPFITITWRYMRLNPIRRILEKSGRWAFGNLRGDHRVFSEVPYSEDKPHKYISLPIRIDRSLDDVWDALRTIFPAPDFHVHPHHLHKIVDIRMEIYEFVRAKQEEKKSAKQDGEETDGLSLLAELDRTDIDRDLARFFFVNLRGTVLKNLLTSTPIGKSKWGNVPSKQVHVPTTAAGEIVSDLFEEVHNITRTKQALQRQFHRILTKGDLSPIEF
jgi:hypothetical protein